MSTSVSPLSPGIYTAPAPSGYAPIAGVATTTAAFIGVVSSGGDRYDLAPDKQEIIADGTTQKYALAFYVPSHDSDRVSVSATEEFHLETHDDDRRTVIAFEVPVAKGETIEIRYAPQSVKLGEVKLCTHFDEFKDYFGNFSQTPGQNYLAHAVYGFFLNGGTRCYAIWVSSLQQVDAALATLNDIDEIAIVAAPGVTDKGVLEAIDIHCRQTTGDRVAIFDAPETFIDTSYLKPGEGILPAPTDCAALYFPWLQVYDYASNGNIFVPPSGHVAGIYARVSDRRNIHKSPTREPLIGAIGLKYHLTKRKQDELIVQCVNCISPLEGRIRIWGDRAWGTAGDRTFQYLSIRRTFYYLRESVDECIRWTTCDCHGPELQAKIDRNVTAFLTDWWRCGALLGDVAAEAFYIKCDADINPPYVREAGKVVTEIGLALVKPRQFTIVRFQHWAGPGQLLQ